ncbi:hypothetical protein BV898_18963 [Hypsibius exemplaris]|uniref:DNA-directed DNA polymerase n=1 Tax=Hypsibius exemplaris TaxID=2072580 RepID=A0A9X6NKV7_HYPEX|nr:hypothetical protein BV898_18963 [Hypsibius exemplaris]
MNVCMAYEKCDQCFRNVRAPDGKPKSDPHECRALYCAYCKKIFPPSHLCYMATGESAIAKPRYKGRPPLRRQKSDDKPASSSTVISTFDRLTFCYDFECTIDAQGNHEPCNVEVQCLEHDDIKEGFEGIGCADLFLTWIFANCMNCVFLAHNAGHYDNLLVCQALEKQGRWVKKIQNGSTIIQMEITQLGIRFIDSLFFFLEACASCPEILVSTKRRRGFRICLISLAMMHM